MRKSVLIALLLSFCIGSMADDVESVKKQINGIKKDSQYIYADVTASTIEDAKDLAEEALYANINEWATNQKKLGNSVSTVKPHEEKWVSLAIPRGNMFRSFIYVKKSDLLPSGNAEATSVASVASNASAAPSSADAPVPALVKDIAACVKYDELAAKITHLKEEGKISKYGRYASLDNPQDYYLAVYNREGKIVAVLSSGSSRINVRTGQADSEKNYKGCGAIGFKINN